MSKVRMPLFEDAASGGVSVPAKYLTLGSAKAWVHFDGTGTPAVTSSLNMTSITDHAAGNFTTTKTSAMSSVLYLARAMAGVSTAASGWGLGPRVSAPTTTAWRMLTASFAFGDSDCAYTSVVYHGTLA